MSSKSEVNVPPPLVVSSGGKKRVRRQPTEEERAKQRENKKQREAERIGMWKGRICERTGAGWSAHFSSIEKNAVESLADLTDIAVRFHEMRPQQIRKIGGRLIVLTDRKLAKYSREMDLLRRDIAALHESCVSIAFPDPEKKKKKKRKKADDYSEDEEEEEEDEHSEDEEEDDEDELDEQPKRKTSRA